MKGITVILYDKEEIGRDGMNKPIYKETPVKVENVLVAPSSSDDVLETFNLTGKKAVYNLAIPKGDTHEWEDKKVRFFDKDWRVIGFATEGIEKLIPLSWNKKVQVERYG